MRRRRDRCHGATGATGAAGTTALVSTTPEPAGANCQYGGTRVDSGLDTNGNGTLDPSEITDTAYVCNGPGLSWVNVTTDTAVQTAVNTGYIDNNASSQVTFTLPASPAVGDIVRFTGAAGPGYTVAQNAGQSVSLAGLSPWSSLSGSSFTQLGVPLTQSGGYSVATSADGQVVVAVVEWYSTILVSYDGGQTFTNLPLPSGFAGQKVGFPAVSPDGKTIYIGAYGPAGFFVSQNGGPLVNVTTMNGIGWFAPFNGGGVLAYVAQSAANAGIWLSKDYGQTWTQQTLPGAPATPCWESVAASYDGKTLAAAANGNGSCPAMGIYISQDAGQTWTGTSGTGSPIGDRSALVSVSPGGNEVVVDYGEKYPIFLSNDGGATWRNTGAFTTNARPAALSADGRRIVVADPTQARVVVSNDAGHTWTAYTTDATPNSIAGSRSLSPLYLGAHATAGVYVEQSLSTVKPLRHDHGGHRRLGDRRHRRRPGAAVPGLGVVDRDQRAGERLRGAVVREVARNQAGPGARASGPVSIWGRVPGRGASPRAPGRGRRRGPPRSRRPARPGCRARSRGPGGT